MFTLLLAGVFALVYGALIAFGALKAMRQEKLSVGSAALMGTVGLIIMFSALFIPFQIQPAFYALLLGLIAMNIIATINKESSPQKPIVRIIISLLIAGIIFSGISLS